jgi:hypothetical protein
MLRTKNNVLPAVVNGANGGKLYTWIHVSNRWGNAVRLKPKIGKWLLSREFPGEAYSGKALDCCKALVIEANMRQWEMFEVAVKLLGLSGLSRLMQFIEGELSCLTEEWEEEFLNKAYNFVDDLHDATYEKKYGN